MSITRLFFATDIHGSTLCWSKFLDTIEKYNINVAIMAGDLCAKAILPIVQQENSSSYRTTLFGRKYEITSRKELDELAEKAKRYGFLPYTTEKNELAKIRTDFSYQSKIFSDLNISCVNEWMEMAKTRSINQDTKIMMIPGNDDNPKIDEIIKQDDFIQHPDQMSKIDAYHKLISYEYVNPTPWDSIRELPDNKLKKELEKVFKSVDDYEHLVAAIHAPPWQSELDNAPKLDKNKRPVFILGHPAFVPVGSKAVREIIEKYQPKLTLHGHIHESGGFTNIGRTLCINPGSEYDEGILRGYFIDLSKEKIENFMPVEA